MSDSFRLFGGRLENDHPDAGKCSLFVTDHSSLVAAFAVWRLGNKSQLKPEEPAVWRPWEEASGRETHLDGGLGLGHNTLNRALCPASGQAPSRVCALLGLSGLFESGKGFVESAPDAQ